MGITDRLNKIIPEYESGTKISLLDLEGDSERIYISEASSPTCVGFIDIVGSTKITARLNCRQMSRFYGLFINWASAVVRAYGGRVVKNIGDGLLFYFPLGQEKADSKQIADCLDCSIALSMLHPSINRKFRSEDLPALDYRISLDYGEVSFASTSESLNADIFSVTVSVCSKINSFAAPNSVVVGGDMYEVCKKLSGYSFKELRKSVVVANRTYPVYAVNESRTVHEYLRAIRRADAIKELQEHESRIPEVKVV
jgi:class 3 adenylate cyclase